MKSKIVRSIESAVDFFSTKLNLTPEAILKSKKAFKKAYTQTKPVLEKAINTARSKEVNDSVKKVNAKIKKLIDKEKLVIIPTMKEVGASIKKDSISLASNIEPEFKKVLTSLTDTLKKSFPNTAEVISEPKPKRKLVTKKSSVKKSKT